MTNLFRPQGAFGWFSYTTSGDTIAPCGLPSGRHRKKAQALYGAARQKQKQKQHQKRDQKPRRSRPHSAASASAVAFAFAVAFDLAVDLPPL
ncbi:hypothetical protein LZ023_33575 [Pseudomonas silvicola]|nr:hypothetical protein LZ023_33575 [Pseudomonas silvicola]